MIHKEGYMTILIVVLALIIINVLYYHFFGNYKWPGYILQAGSIFLLVLVLQFFRNPNRNVVENEYVVLSPADGEVVAIEEVEEPEYFKDKRIQVSIFMSVWNVHANRWPISGKVTYFKHHQGKYLLAAHPKSSTENEHTSIVVADKNGVEILFRQIAGFVARRIVAPINEGDTAKQGQQFGFIKFGSRVDMFFPLGTKIRVKNGDKVYGGLNIIADMPR
ncbi:MAG: phosphatidylserine decarboxylase family protein [Bacteroidales bacterium]|jgi:phosphatidylserine decarboxylase|nr:phosphatidylserine decarboxylase family protein [Bacteroidales bacterium]MBQ5403949.1 phosphatidylserine decarboxylase family protein [Bacteroidales bacterium]